MMKYFLLLAKYNRDANNKMLQILESMSEDSRMDDRGSYFKSLHGLLDHIAAVSVVYQSRIRNSFGDVDGLSHKYSDYKIDFGKINFLEFSELAEAQRVLDDAFVKVVEAFKEEDLNRSMTFNTPRGEVTINLGIFLLRYINHGSHHRGQISQILDEMKISNDFSGIAANYE